MSKDYQELIYRVESDSDILRVYPDAVVVIYAADTVTPIVWSGNADQFGILNITTLPTGKYDIYVGGVYTKSINHVTADYAMKHPETWTSFISGAVTGDVNEAITHQIFYSALLGKILRVKVVVNHVGVTGNATIHILKGTSNRSTAMTFAADSLWSIQCNPGLETYGWSHVATAANLVVAAQSNVTIAVDYVTGTVEGVGVTMMFKAD